MTLMPPRRHLPVGDMERIIGMLLTGQTQRHVGCQFNARHTVVGRMWQGYLDTGSGVERARRGRLRKTTDRDDRYIVNIAKHWRFESAKKLNADFPDASGVRICDKLLETDFMQPIFARRSAVHPPLT